MHVESMHVAEYITVTIKTTQHIGSHSFRLLIHSRDDSDVDIVSKTVSNNILASSHSHLAVLTSIWQHLLLMEASSNS